MRQLAVFCLVFTSLMPFQAQAATLSPKQLRALPDQAQVRVLGRVTQSDAKAQSLRIEANGMAFIVERPGAVRMPRLRPGDRVLITGELQPEGKILLESIQPIRAAVEDRPLVGMLISVDRTGRRLILKSETGTRARINYRPDTTFVRLGRRSRADELRYGDRLWVSRKPDGRGAGPASRVEVVEAKEGRFTGIGEITAVDSVRQQLRVRFGAAARTVLVAQAVIAGPARAAGFRSLKIGQNIQVIGAERRGVIVAQRVQRLP